MRTNGNERAFDTLSTKWLEMLTISSTVVNHTLIPRHFNEPVPDNGKSRETLMHQGFPGFFELI